MGFLKWLGFGNVRDLADKVTAVWLDLKLKRECRWWWWLVPAVVLGGSLLWCSIGRGPGWSNIIFGASEKMEDTAWTDKYYNGELKDEPRVVIAARRGEVLQQLKEELDMSDNRNNRTQVTYLILKQSWQYHSHLKWLNQVVTVDLSSLDSLEGKAEEIVQVVKIPHLPPISLFRPLVGWMCWWTVEGFQSGVAQLKLYWRFTRGWWTPTTLVPMASVGEIIVSSGALELTKHLVPHLKAQGGLIVNISSLQVLVHSIALHTTHIFQGRIAIPHRAAYAASKHALQVVAYQGSNETVNLFRPGQIA